MKKCVFTLVLLILAIQFRAQNLVPESLYTPEFQPKIEIPHLTMNFEYAISTKGLIHIWDSLAEYSYTDGELVLKQYRKAADYYYENGLPKIFYVFSADGDTLYRYFYRYFDNLRVEYFYTKPYAIFYPDYVDSSIVTLFDDGQWIDVVKSRHIKHPIYGDLWTFSMSFDYDTITNQFTGGSLNQIFFDQNNFIDYYIEKDFLASTEQWQNRYKVTYTVYDDGKIQSYIGQGFNVGTQTWFNDYKTEYYYNENGLFDSLIYYDWDEVAYEWIGEQKITYDYTDTLITQTYYNWNGAWTPSEKNLYYYDQEGKIIYSINKNFDPNSNDFINDTRNVYTYDNSGNLIEQKFQYWNLDSAKWDENSRYYYEYNDFGKMTLYLYQTWSDQWINNDRYLYSYVDDTLYAGYLHQRWDSDSLFWKNKDKKEYAYDQGRIVSYSYSYWTDAKGWITTSKTEYYWKLADVADNEPVAQTRYIYPNPATDYFYIPYQEAKVRIYSLDGKLIKQFETYDSKIGVADLETGIYVVEIVTNSKVQTEKLIKK